MTLVAFRLTMPNVGSWDGKWSGSGGEYIRVRRLSTEAAAKIVNQNYYHYDFGDGWAAGVECKQVDYKQAAKYRKKSNGFRGYDWMIDEIIKYGKIYGRHPKPDEKTYATVEEAEAAA